MKRYFQHASHKKKVVSTINNIMQIDCLMSHYSLYKSSEKRAKTIKTSTMSMCVCSPFPKQVFHYLSHHATNIPFQTLYFGCVLQKNSYSLRTENYFFQIPFPFLFILDTPQKTSVLSDSNYKWFADDFGGADKNPGHQHRHATIYIPRYLETFVKKQKSPLQGAAVQRKVIFALKCLYSVQGRKRILMYGQ